MKSHKDRISENLYRPIKYLRKELESAIDVIRVRNTAAQGFFKTLQTLDEEKEKLIAYDNFKKVEIDQAANEHQIDILALRKESTTDESAKQLIKYLMFPTKRKLIQEMRKSLGFFNQQFQSQISELGRSLTTKLCGAQASLSLEMKEIHLIEVRFWEAAFERAINALGLAES